MNRHQRRAAAKGQQRPFDRAEAIRLAYAALANCDDGTIAGGTLILPDGESMFLDVGDVRAVRDGNQGRGRA